MDINQNLQLIKQYDNIVKWMANQELVFLDEVDKKVEGLNNIPMFRDIFYKNWGHSGWFSQKSFVDLYMNAVDDRYKSTGLEARIRRVYPSLVREAHFGMLLRASFSTVFNSRDLDCKEGVDYLLITPDGLGLGLGLTMSTKRSLEFLKQKIQERHNIKFPVLYLTPDEHSGRFMYHSPEQIRDIKAYMVSKIRYLCDKYGNKL